MKHILSINEHKEWRSGKIIPELLDFFKKNVKIESKKIGDKILTLLYFGDERETLLTSKSFIINKILNYFDQEILDELGQLKEADLRKTCREFINSINPEDHLNEGLKEWATIFTTALALNLVPPQIAKADIETKKEWVANNGPEIQKEAEKVNPWERKNSKSNRYFLRSVSVGKSDSKETAKDLAEKSNLENIQNQAVFILKSVRSDFNLPEKTLNKPNIKLERGGLDENSGVWFRKTETSQLAYVTQEIEINSIRDWVLKELKKEGIKATPEFEQIFVDALEKLKEIDQKNTQSLESFIKSPGSGSIISGGTWQENILRYSPNQKPPEIEEVKPVKTPSHNKQLRASGHNSKLYKKFFRCGRLRILG